jgi:hypothetical protein
MLGYRGDPALRFWPRVNKAGPTPPHAPELGPCWVWTGTCFNDGYGAFSLRGRNHRAPRVAYELTFGHPGSLQVNHLCDNKKCVNPTHLYLGTQLENMRDRHQRGGLWACRRGRRALTAAQVTAARELRALGNTYRYVAAQFGVSLAAVWNAINEGQRDA